MKFNGSILPRTDFLASAVAIGAGAIFAGIDLFFSFDLFAHSLAWLAQLHFGGFEIDEAVLVAIFAMIGMSIDYVRFRRHEEIRRHRVESLRLTMTTMNDVVNNMLSNMQFIHFRASRGDHLNDNEIKLLETEIENVSNVMKKLNQLENLDGRDFGQGISGVKII